MGTRLLLLLALFLLTSWLGISPAAAQEKSEPDPDLEPDLEIELEPVVVIGDEIKSERELDNPTKFMTVIDVAEQPERFKTVADVLRETVGVQINRLGGLGSFATVSIRGSSASQVQVYIDGVPMNRAVSGVTNLDDLPLDNVAYIEIFRGFTPPDFGQAGIGGVINLVTRQGLESHTAVRLSYGSFGTDKAEVIISGPVRDVRVLLFAGTSGSRGGFSYTNENGTPAVGRDDFEDLRVNNDFRAWDVTARAEAEREQWEYSLAGAFHGQEQGLPGLAAAQAESTRLDSRRWTGTGSARNRSLAGGAVDLTLAADWVSDIQTYDDPEGELGTGGPRTTENRMETAGARVKAVWTIPEIFARLTGFVEYRRETYLPVERLPREREGDRQTRTLLAYVMQAEISDPSGTITAQTTLREEHYWNDFAGDPFAPVAGGVEQEDYFQFFSPSAGLVIHLSDDFAFKGNVGRYYRAPTFYELFGDRGTAVGNTELVPERGLNYDLGFIYRGRDRGPLRGPYVEYAFFQSWVSDMIIFFQNSQRTVRPVNLGEAVVSGHEVSFGLGLGDNVRVSGNYTFQAPVDRGEVPHWYDNQLPLRPMHEAWGRVEYAPLENVKLFADATYISGNFWDRANVFEIADRHIYNAGITVGLYRRGPTAVQLTVEGKNLADERIADVAGYPLPGTSWFGTLEAKW